MMFPCAGFILLAPFRSASEHQFMPYFIRLQRQGAEVVSERSLGRLQAPVG